MTPLALLVLLRPSGSRATFEGRKGAPAMASASYFPNCSAARAAGMAPFYRGEPGYRLGLDRDSDGIACEPYSR